MANVYLIDFDKAIVESFVKTGCFYRRYSDDLVIICDVSRMTEINNQVSAMIKDFFLKISPHKTEKFVFKNLPYKNKERLYCGKIKEGKVSGFDSYMTYLGFEFRGFNTTIKSSNLSKYYRRIIGVVKRRAKRSQNARKKNPSLPHAIYYNQIKKLINKPLKYRDSDKAERQVTRGANRFVLNDNGTYRLEKLERTTNTKKSNYYGYVKRCAEIFGDDIFLHQIKKRRKIIFQAMRRFLEK